MTIIMKVEIHLQRYGIVYYDPITDRNEIFIMI